MENEQVRKTAKRWGIRLWELANYYCFSEATLYRKLRTQLDAEEEKKWIAAIEELAAIDPEERPKHHYSCGVIKCG